MALMPQAGLAVGLMLLVSDDPIFARSQRLIRERDTFVAVVLAVVLFNELIGPFLTRYALSKSGDVGKDRPRVLDFLGEEHILTGQQAATLKKASGKLVDHWLTCYTSSMGADELHNLVWEGEDKLSVGDGFALLHVRVEGGGQLTGVLGVFPEGVAANGVDDASVCCVVLLVTPASAEDHRMAVSAAFSQALEQGAAFRKQLCGSDSPAHVCELLHADERSESFNHYLAAEADPEEQAATSFLGRSTRGPAA